MLRQKPTDRHTVGKPHGYVSGQFSDHAETGDEWPDLDNHEEEVVSEPPPNPVGQDERRMQVRAYNHWASLLGDRAFPSIEDLEPDGPHAQKVASRSYLCQGLANPRGQRTRRRPPATRRPRAPSRGGEVSPGHYPKASRSLQISGWLPPQFCAVLANPKFLHPWDPDDQISCQK